jgi:hypothetical protein
MLNLRLHEQWTRGGRHHGGRKTCLLSELTGPLAGDVGEPADFGEADQRRDRRGLKSAGEGFLVQHFHADCNERGAGGTDSLGYRLERQVRCLPQGGGVKGEVR